VPASPADEADTSKHGDEILPWAAFRPNSGNSRFDIALACD
jgi:hypothetical protein